MPKLDPMNISKRLQQVCREKRITPKELARRLGMNEGTVHNYWMGVNIPLLSKLIQIANVLNVSLDWLCSSDD